MFDHLKSILNPIKKGTQKITQTNVLYQILVSQKLGN